MVIKFHYIYKCRGGPAAPQHSFSSPGMSRLAGCGASSMEHSSVVLTCQRHTRPSEVTIPPPPAQTQPGPTQGTGYRAGTLQAERGSPDWACRLLPVGLPALITTILQASLPSWSPAGANQPTRSIISRVQNCTRNSSLDETESSKSQPRLCMSLKFEFFSEKFEQTF